MNLLILLLAFHPNVPRWVPVKDVYKVHMRYQLREPDNSELAIGEYYQFKPNDFIATCYDNLHEFASEQEAKTAVEGCYAAYKED